MALNELEKPIKDIIALVEKLDEKYRQKSFEILLDFYLRKKLGVEVKEPKTDEEIEEGEEAEIEEEFLIPIDVRAFLTQQGISEERLYDLFYIEKEEIRRIYQITTTKKAGAQIQIALLSALENAMQRQGNKFEFSIEEVRQRCKDLKVYDGPNFRANFRNNEDLFKEIDDLEVIELSPEGKTELAEVIATVAK